MHRIPGLSNRFIYSNDDFFLMRPICPVKFWNLPHTVVQFWKTPRTNSDDDISSVIYRRIPSKLYQRALVWELILAFWVIPKLFSKTFLLHQKMNWYFILKKAKSTERHMVQEKSTNINVSVQKKKWEMANAITIRRAISLNAFGMDTTAMIYYHCLLIILINALVIIKGNGWIERFEITWLWR